MIQTPLEPHIDPKPKSMAKATPIYIPEHFSNLALDCRDCMVSEVEVIPYKTLTEKIIQAVANEFVICVADHVQFYRLTEKIFGESKELSLTGKVILFFENDEFKGVDIHKRAGIDIMQHNPQPDFWLFKINKTLDAIHQDMELNELKVLEMKQSNDLDTLNEIGMALSTEKDLNQLLELIVAKCREMTWADAGSLYMIEPDPNIPDNPEKYLENKKMIFQVAQNFSKQVPFRSFVVDITNTSIYGHVAITQKFLNF